MDEFELLIDLHKTAHRQGPGDDTETMLALDLARVDRDVPLKVADIGCGTGASTLVLAQSLKNAQITAVDFLQEFLDELHNRAISMGVSEKITTLAGSMDALPFGEAELDLIWSEGAIYNIGFEKGIRDWRRFLKPGGVLVASEITWMTDSRPAGLARYWAEAYPEIDLASSKIRLLEQYDYAPIGYFVLPEHCWLENYYRPMQGRFEGFLDRHGHSAEAQAIVAAEQKEIELYEQFKTFFSYGVYIAKKVESKP